MESYIFLCLGKKWINFHQFTSIQSDWVRKIPGKDLAPKVYINMKDLKEQP